VIGPLPWPDAQIPGPGHYCLISILDSPNDPAPNLAGVHTIDEFVAMGARRQQRRLEEYRDRGHRAGGPTTYSFYAQGLRSKRHTMDLELDLSRFAPGVRVAVKAPTRCLVGAEVESMNILNQSSINVVLSHPGGIGRIRNIPCDPREKAKFTSRTCAAVGAGRGLPNRGATAGGWAGSGRLHARGQDFALRHRGRPSRKGSPSAMNVLGSTASQIQPASAGSPGRGARTRFRQLPDLPGWVERQDSRLGGERVCLRPLPALSRRCGRVPRQGAGR